MPQSPKKWTFKPLPDSEKAAQLAQKLAQPPALAKLLLQRGIEETSTARSFFQPRLADLHDPFLMKDMHRAVERINAAIARKEKIMIYGDYDVDGTSSVALLYSFLRAHYQSLITYIPDRYKEGYGVSITGIDHALQEGCQLVICLDCGIKALEQISYAADHGLHFIVCDHHRPGNQLPPAYAILNPKQEGCNYPFKELSGCGVGFKLCQALAQDWSLPAVSWKKQLDLVALSIGADIVPIIGENRVLAHFGLILINKKPRPGIAALKASAGQSNRHWNISDVVFLLGPRINAAGRISHGSLAVKILAGEALDQLEEVSQEVNQQNQERKELDQRITEEALEMIENAHEEDRRTTVVYHEKWHKGVIGIVASRLIEQFYRPTVVFTKSGALWAGSARSVAGFDIYQSLEACADHLEQFGGHMYAAGMTIREEQLQAFKQRFESVVRERIHPDQLQAKVEVDLKLPVVEINWPLYEGLQLMEPFGPHNLPPVFVCEQLQNDGSKRVGAHKEHLKLRLRGPAGQLLSGIAFRQGEMLPILEKADRDIAVAFHLECNVFKGEKSLQLRVLDLRLGS